MKTGAADHRVTSGGQTIVSDKEIEEISRGGSERMQELLNASRAKQKKAAEANEAKTKRAEAKERYREYLKNISSARKANPLKLRANYNLAGQDYLCGNRAFNHFINGGQKDFEILREKLEKFISYDEHRAQNLINSFGLIELIKDKLDSKDLNNEKEILQRRCNELSELVIDGVFKAITENRSYISSISELSRAARAIQDITNTIKLHFTSQDSDTLESLDDITTNAQNLVETIKEFYTKVKSENINETAFIQKVDLNKTLRSVIRSAQANLKEIQGINLEANIDEQLEHKVINTDPKKLIDILTCLLHNAIEEMKRSDTEGTILLKAFSPQSDQYCFQVSNPGEIKEQDKDRIFEDGETGPEKERLKGNETKGKGLTTSRKFARLLGGDLVIKSQKDPVTFTATITNTVNTA